LTAAAVGVAVALSLAAVVPGSSAGAEQAAAAGVAAPAFPGGNGQVAFVSDRDGGAAIYAMEPDGSGVTRVVDLGVSTIEDGPAWSPDGTRIAFSAGSGAGNDLYVVDADGSEIDQLTDSSTSDSDPAWSPDGSRILFSRDRAGWPGHSQIWAMDADGSDEELLIATPPGSDEFPPGSAADPAWSPDGAAIAYTRTDEGIVTNELVVANSRGSGAERIYARPSGNVTSPDWSPAGGRIAFSVSAFTGELSQYDVHAVDADGRNDSPLADDPSVPELDPAWSPDGRSIAYSHGFASRRGIWRMTAGGTGETRISADVTVQDWKPSWQPLPPELTISPTTAERETDTEHAVAFVVTDADGTPGAFTELLVSVAGANPHYSAVRTDNAGTTSYNWTGTEPGTDTLTACVDLNYDGVCEPAPTVTATVTWTDPGGPFDPPRIAFTDDDDALYQVRVAETEAGERYSVEGAPDSYATELSGFQAGPRHEGEAGGIPGSPPAFVSTRQHPSGEVYVQTAFSVERITCNDTAETHPVVLSDGSVAYAQDSDPDPEAEDWDIYVTSPPEIILNRPAPGWSKVTHERSPGAKSAGEAVAIAPGSCEPGWTTVQVTEGAATDLWPAGTVDGSLVFSRAVVGRLADLYEVDPAETANGWGTPVALTETEDVEESQPTAMEYEVSVTPPDCDSSCVPTIVTQDWIAFTIVEFGGAGRIAFLPPDHPDEISYGPEGREPAWSSSENPTHLAFTSTEEDPYGDIWVASLEDPGADVAAGTTDPPVVDSESNLASGLQGVAESHPFWLLPFGEGDARIVFTARSDVDIASEERILDADVSDVRATDGAQRRVLRRAVETDESEVVHRYDEAGPSYSPDGTRIVYSRDAFGPGESFDARVLMVADADGTGPAPLLPITQRRNSDIDLDPVWSPDGSRIAFVRVRVPTEDEPVGSVGVWIHDLEAGTTTQLETAPRGADLSPSWAPDGKHLVVARSRSEEGCCQSDGARRWGTPSIDGAPELYILDRRTPNAPGVPITYCPDGCGFNLDGRSPVWSPDGSTIAFVNDGELLTVQLPDGWFDGPGTPDEVEVDLPEVVVGFERFGGDPTDSRTVLSSAEDPAWDAEGTEIFFAGQPTGQPDNRGIYRITREITSEGNFVWGPVETITDRRGPETEPAYSEPRQADVELTATVTGSPAIVGDSVVVDFTVTNLGPGYAFGVVLETAYAPGATLAAVAPVPPGCTNNGQGCNFAVLDPGETRTYRVSVSHDSPVLGNAGATVESTTFDPVLINNQDSAPYKFRRGDLGDLRVRVSVDEPVGYVGGLRTVTVGVRNLGPDPVDNVMLDVDLPAGLFPQPSLTLPFCLVVQVPCDLGTLGTVDPGDRERFDVVVRLHSAGERLPIVARVTTTTPDPNLANNRHRALLDVLQPELHILPAVAHPGQVVLAYGEQMPPGTEVEVDWARRTAAGLPLGDPILVNPSRSYLVDDDGSVRIPLLVLRRDLLGERVLTATSTTAEFMPLEAPMIVVLRQLGPPLFVGRG
jgi:Tol biopolymer transport system component